MTAQDIRNLRLELMVTQEEFGSFFGVSRVTVCNWEKGKYSPSFRVQKLMKEKMKELK